MVHFVLYTFLTYFISIVGASLYVGFPFSEQLPDVARVDEEYNFQMANITYKSTGGSVAYYASNLPEWLSFDGQTRTFSGLPSSSDVSDSVTITLTGVDSADGSSITNNYTMVVSSDPGLALSSNDVMFTEISQYGGTNGENGLVVKPGQTFDIKFDTDTFKMDANSTHKVVAYYGRLIDRLSLPNWIKFNSDELSFSGTVPTVTSDIAPSIDYGFSFIASDYQGYAGAVGNFYLVVGAHQLSTSLNESIKINGTLNSDFDITVPILSTVYQDEDLISKENISSVYSDDLPDYVTLNTANYSLTGEFPDSTQYDNFTITVVDKYGNSIGIPYLFDALGSAFTVNDLPNVNVTKGQWLSYQLLSSLFTEGNDTTVTVDYDADWLSFDKDNTTFLGSVPKNFDKVSVKVTATNEYDSDEKSFNFVGVSSTNGTTNSTTSSSSSTSSPTSSTSTSSSSSSASGGKTSKSSKPMSAKTKLAIGLGVGLPVFFILLALLLFFCCYRRRNNEKREQDKFYDKHIVPVKNLDYEKSGAAAGGKRKPRKDQEPELDGPGFGTTVDNDDHDEDAQQLSALNVLKLDEKKKDNSDSKSTSSSLTQVESEYSNYYDASDRPVKSWRAGGDGDAAVGNVAGSGVMGAAAAAAAMKYTNNDEDDIGNRNRQSVGTMSTVNTENLFSVRLVEDGSNRDSNQSSFGVGQQFLTESSINTILRRDDSGNIQRLDSNGNVVDLDVLPREAALEVATGASEPLKPRLSRSASSNLDILMEENSKDRSHDESTIYHSTGDRENETYNTSNASTVPQNAANDVNTEHSFNLLSRFNNSASSSAANSDQQLNSRLYGSDNSLVDEFKAVHASDGAFQWSESNTESKNNSSSIINQHQYPQHQNDFSSANHSMDDVEHSAALQPSLVKDQYSNSPNPEGDHRYSSTSLGRKAKLVEFTRKGSIKDAAMTSSLHDYISGETAYIHDDDSE